MENVVTRVEVEQLIATAIEKRLQQAIEEFVHANEIRLKELSLIDRVVRVEEELKALREISEAKFDASEKRFEALQREIKAGFDASEKHFEALQREMNARFEASNERFVAMDKRFESLQREMSARFEAVDKRFDAVDKRLTTTQWMIGIFVGVPFFVMALIQVIQLLK